MTGSFAWIRGHGTPVLAALGLVFATATALPADANGIRDIAGTYVGSWTNLTFGSTGPAEIDIAFSDSQATIRFDMGGPVFGGFDPPEIMMLGTVVGDDLPISSSGLNVFGDISGSIAGADGSFAFVIENIPGDFIDRVTAEGSIAAGVIDLGYTVIFPGPSGPTNPASGVLTAVIPEPATFALLGLGAGGLAVLRLRGVRSRRDRSPARHAGA